MGMLFSNTEDLNNLTENGKYIRENFLESVFNEFSNEIRNDIIDIEFKENVSISDISNILIKMEAADLNIETNKMYLERLIKAYNENQSDYLIEYSGNEAKNQEFRECLADVEKAVNDFADEQNALEKTGDQIVKLASELLKKKKPEDIKRIIDQMKNKAEDYMSWYNNRCNTIWKDHYLTYKRFRMLSKTFNNKYSDILMKEKKEIDKKFGTLIDKYVEGDVLNWFVFTSRENSTPKTDKILEAYKYIREIDRDQAVELGKYINGFLDFYWKSLCSLIAYINNIRFLLNIEKENKLSYKIVQKVFKSKGTEKGFDLVNKTIQ